jgi:hypothetical protein
MTRQDYLLLAVAVVLFVTNFLGLGFTLRHLRTSHVGSGRGNVDEKEARAERRWEVMAAGSVASSVASSEVGQSPDKRVGPA